MPPAAGGGSFSRNTVQFIITTVWTKVFVNGLGRRCWGRFPFPFGHLAFDDAGVDAVASGGDLLFPHFRQHGAIPCVECLAAGEVAFRKPALKDSEAADERQTVHIHSGLLCRLEHHRADDEMTDRQSVQFLLDAGRRLAAQVRRLFRAEGILMRLLLIKHDLLFPTFVVQQDEVHRWVFYFIQQVGYQAMHLIVTGPLRVVQLVFDHPHQDAVAVFTPVVTVRVNLGQVRSVGEPFDGLEHHRRDDPYQQFRA